jgi:predicted RNA-binding Zn-ribbon protein involved in translation (DUF1610 family)
MSMVENQKMLKAKGMDEFLKNQAEKYCCPSCGDMVCVHDRKCYGCGKKIVNNETKEKSLNKT